MRRVGHAATSEECRLSYHRETDRVSAQVICWVLGEYGVLAPGGARAVVERLVDLAEGQALPEEVSWPRLLLRTNGQSASDCVADGFEIAMLIKH